MNNNLEFIVVQVGSAGTELQWGEETISLPPPPSKPDRVHMPQGRARRQQRNLDEVYFALPIRWGEGKHLACRMGISCDTLAGYLRRLEQEGLASHVATGTWVENLEVDHAELALE